MDRRSRESEQALKKKCVSGAGSTNPRREAQRLVRGPFTRGILNIARP